MAANPLLPARSSPRNKLAAAMNVAQSQDDDELDEVKQRAQRSPNRASKPGQVRKALLQQLQSGQVNY